MSLASRKLIQATADAADTGDDDFANVVLLLDGDGTSGDDNNTFTDSSTNGFTVTENGSVVQGSFSPYGDNWSNYFDGSGDYLTFADDASFNLGAGDFTVECWAYFNSSVDQYFFGQIQNTLSNRSFQLALISSKLYFEVRSGTTAYTITAASNVVLNQWTHLAAVRNGNTITLYQDGASIGTVDVTGVTINNSSNSMGVGSGGGYVAAPMNGYLSNARLVVGTAVYTSEFTPSTSPLTAITNTVLLTCQSNRFVDESTNNHTVTVNGTPKVTPFSPFRNDEARDITVDGGSGYFDANGDYLSLADTATLQMGNGDFTIEAWIYINTHKDYNYIYSYSYPYQLLVDSNGNLESFFNDADNSVSYISVQGSSVIPTGAWNHVAVVRNGSSFKQYVNGVEDGSTTSSVTLGVPSTYDPIIGNWGTGNYAINGYISNVRIVKGTAVYTSAFTPPTAPLTAISGTSLLLNFQDAGIYDLTGINNLDTVGNAQIDTAVKKYGTGSIEFDGTGDILRNENPHDLALGTGDFTVEFWLNASNVSTTQVFFDMRHNSNANTALTVFVSSGFKFYAGTSSVVIGTISNSTWHHIAIVRDGSTIRSFIDGVAGGTEANTNDLTCEAFRIGARWDNGTPMTGFIDDFRITRGVARYTSSFTPPDAALPKF